AFIDFGMRRAGHAQQGEHRGTEELGGLLHGDSFHSNIDQWMNVEPVSGGAVLRLSLGAATAAVPSPSGTASHLASCLPVGRRSVKRSVRRKPRENPQFTEPRRSRSRNNRADAVKKKAARGGLC